MKGWADTAFTPKNLTSVSRIRESRMDGASFVNAVLLQGAEIHSKPLLFRDLNQIKTESLDLLLLPLNQLQKYFKCGAFIPHFFSLPTYCCFPPVVCWEPYSSSAVCSAAPLWLDEQKDKEQYFQQPNSEESLTNIWIAQFTCCFSIAALQPEWAWKTSLATLLSSFKILQLSVVHTAPFPGYFHHTRDGWRTMHPHLCLPSSFKVIILEV